MSEVAIPHWSPMNWMHLTNLHVLSVVNGLILKISHSRMPFVWSF